MRYALLLSAILLASGNQAFASEAQIDGAPPVRFTSDTPTVVVRQGINPKRIHAGLTILDKVDRPVICTSSYGCLITAKVWVVFDGNEDGGPTVSAYVDGTAMNPVPNYGSVNWASAQQSAIVTTGSHLLHSQVSQSVTAGRITGWNVEYVMYELKNPHASGH